MGLRLDPSKLMGREVSPEAAPLPVPQDDAAHAENLRLLAELEALKAKLAAAATVPEKLAVTTFPGEVGRERVNDTEVVIIRGDWDGKVTFGAFRVRNGSLSDKPIRDMRHTAAFWVDPVNTAAIRLCQEAAAKEA